MYASHAVHMTKRTRRASLKLILASLAAAAALSGGLAVQMAQGNDPALGSGAKTAQNGASQRDTSTQSGTATQTADPPASVVTRSS